MQLEAIRSVQGTMDGDFDTKKTARPTPAPVVSTAPAAAAAIVQQTAASGNVQSGEQEEEKEGKEPSKNTIESVVSEVNQKMRLTKTRCEYSYDEPTKRVSIKVYDKDSDTLIREVPPEKSLEMLQKMWEIAGIIVDEKR